MDYNASATLFKILSHPVRLQILDMLQQGEICVCHIENALGKRQPYVSQQLMVLRDAGVVQTRKDGLQVYYRISDPQIQQLLTVMCGTGEQVHYEVIDACPRLL